MQYFAPKSQVCLACDAGVIPIGWSTLSTDNIHTSFALIDTSTAHTDIEVCLGPMATPPCLHVYR